MATAWQLDIRCRELLSSASLIHEIGLSVDFRKGPEHAGYLVSNLDLPGFTPAQRRLLAVLLRNQSGPLDIHSLNQQNALTPREAGCLCRLLRLAIIFASRRRDDTLPSLRIRASAEGLIVTLPVGWQQSHPLRAEALQQEIQWQSYVQWSLMLEEQKPSTLG